VIQTLCVKDLNC